MIRKRHKREKRSTTIRKTLGRALTRALLLALLGAAGCGGGVATEPTAPGAPAPVPARQAVLTLAASGTLPESTAIGGLGVTVNLPETVSVRTTAAGNVAEGVVSASGPAASQATVLALYTGPTASVPARLYLVLASGETGMSAGEFATITCEVKPDANPAPSDFSLSDFSAVDTSGASIPALSASLSESIR